MCRAGGGGGDWSDECWVVSCWMVESVGGGCGLGWWFGLLVVVADNPLCVRSRTPSNNPPHPIKPLSSIPFPLKLLTDTGISSPTHTSDGDSRGFFSGGWGSGESGW